MHWLYCGWRLEWFPRIRKLMTKNAEASGQGDAETIPLNLASETRRCFVVTRTETAGHHCLYTRRPALLDIGGNSYASLLCRWRGIRREQHGLKVGLIVESKLQQAVAAVQIQFVADVQPVVFHRLDAYLQQIGDFLAGAIFRNEFQDTPLSRSQFINLWFAQQQ